MNESYALVQTVPSSKSPTYSIFGAILVSALAVTTPAPAMPSPIARSVPTIGARSVPAIVGSYSPAASALILNQSRYPSENLNNEYRSGCLVPSFQTIVAEFYQNLLEKQKEEDRVVLLLISNKIANLYNPD